MRLGAVLLFLLPAWVWAQDAPLVRVEVSPEQVRVGEAVALEISVFVPTWFAKPPVYPDFELANAMTRLPPDSSYPTSERVDGKTWAGIVRTYRISPLIGGTYRIAGEAVSVTWANPGSKPMQSEIAVPDIVFRATVPAGAEGLDPYLAGRGLTLELDVGGDDRALLAGDAVVLKYRAELDGLPAIFLPSLAPRLNPPGVSVHYDAPQIDDGPPAARRETMTLVFETGGEVEVPPVTLAYWNTTSKRVETAMTDSMNFTIAGPPPTPAEKTAAGGVARWPRIAASALLALVFVIIVYGSIRFLREPLRAAAARRRASEASAFAALERALARENADAVYPRLLGWIERLSPSMDSRAFARAFGDSQLVEQVEALSSQRFGEGPAPAWRKLRRGLESARARYLERTSPSHRQDLPPLNP